MVKYISALTLALFSLSAVAQNASVSQPQPASEPAEVQHVLVAQAAVQNDDEAIESEPAPGAAAGGVGSNQLEAPVVVGVVGAAALAAVLVSSSGGSSTSHH